MNGVFPMNRVASLVLVLGLGFFAGCSDRTAPTTPPLVTAVAVADDHDHDHDRAKMKVAHLGKHHAWLTAHLSTKEGHELDIFVEEMNAPKSVALAVSQLRGKATKDGDAKEYDLTFEPAPVGERPAGETAGTCSHFVAKTPWLTPGDLWTIVVEVELDGRNRKATWKNFSPKAFAHHED